MDKFLYEELRLRMAYKAKVFGIWALVLSVFLISIPYAAIGMAGLSILFAFLSKGYKPKIDRDAKLGVGLSVIGLVIAFVAIGSSFYKLSTDSEFRSNVFDYADELYENMYGDEYEENFSDMFEQYFGGDSHVDL